MEPIQVLSEWGLRVTRIDPCPFRSSLPDVRRFLSAAVGERDQHPVPMLFPVGLGRCGFLGGPVVVLDELCEFVVAPHDAPLDVSERREGWQGETVLVGVGGDVPPSTPVDVTGWPGGSWVVVVAHGS